MKKPRKKQRLKELIVREIKRYLDDPDTIEAVTAINYKDGTKTVNYNGIHMPLEAGTTQFRNKHVSLQDLIAANE